MQWDQAMNDILMSILVPLLDRIPIQIIQTQMAISRLIKPIANNHIRIVRLLHIDR